MKLTKLIALLAIMASPCMASDERDAVFSAYRKCVNNTISPITELIEIVGDGLSHQDILLLWAKELIPTRDFEAAFQGLGNTNFEPMAKLINTMSVRLKHNKYQKLMIFVKSKLAKSKFATCRSLPPKIAVQLQGVIIQAYALNSELKASYELAKEYDALVGQIDPLKKRLSAIEQLGWSLQKQLGGE
jgi:hypothetical protein